MNEDKSSVHQAAPLAEQGTSGSQLPVVGSEIVPVVSVRKLLIGIARSAGAGFSEDEVRAQGRDFGDWEAGFNAACDAIEDRFLSALDRADARAATGAAQ